MICLPWPNKRSPILADQQPRKFTSRIARFDTIPPIIMVQWKIGLMAIESFLFIWDSFPLHHDYMGYRVIFTHFVHFWFVMILFGKDSHPLLSKESRYARKWLSNRSNILSWFHGPTSRLPLLCSLSKWEQKVLIVPALQWMIMNVPSSASQKTGGSRKPSFQIILITSTWGHI